MNLVSLTAKVSSFLAIIAIVFVFSGVEGKGQCSSPYILKSDIFLIGSCHVKVDYCYYKDPYPNFGYIFINIVGVTNLDPPPCTLPSNYWNLIHQAMSDLQCSLGNLINCENGSKKEISISTPSCYKWVSDFSVVNGLPLATGTHIEFCDMEITCTKTYEICCQNGIAIKTLTRVYAIGTPNCNYTPLISPIPNPFDPACYHEGCEIVP